MRIYRERTLDPFSHDPDLLCCLLSRKEWGKPVSMRGARYARCACEECGRPLYKIADGVDAGREFRFESKHDVESVPAGWKPLCEWIWWNG